MGQRSSAGGWMATRVLSGSVTAASSTRSSPPQAPGPISRGISVNAATAARRWSQSLALSVTAAESKWGPAASAKLGGAAPCTIAGRGRGSVTSSAMARPQPAATSHSPAISCLIGPHIRSGLRHFSRRPPSRVGPRALCGAPPRRSVRSCPGWRGAPAQTTKNQEGNAMLGLMQDWPLLCHRIIDHAAKFHGERKVVSRSVEGPIVETTYAANPRPRAQSGAAAGEGRHQARRPRRHHGLEHRRATWKPGTASSASARSITPSTRVCSPSRSCGSSIMRKTA